MVTTGVFRYIRHPLYTSLLLLTWGVCFKQIDMAALSCALISTLFLWLTARRDEAECLAHFGEPYRQYMWRSKRFIPFLI